MTARAEVAAALSMICAGCDGQMVVTKDAIGRDRLRCPKCQGVSRIRPHPDQVLVPQGLVRAASALPQVEPGQLRCQRCARGVAGRARFCSTCTDTRRREKRQVRCACGAVFVRKRRSSARSCPTCRERRAAKPMQLCTGCHRLQPRPRHGRSVVLRCAECRPKAAEKTRYCTGCGRVSERRSGRATTKTCAACRRAGNRSSRRYQPKPCANCTLPFVPTGPRARYCEACR